MPEPALTVVIVNYRGRQYLDELLGSLRSQSLRQFRTLVIDNDSRDGSVEHLNRVFRWVEVFPQKRNLGYARAGNLGLRLARSEQVVILNTDLKLHRDFLSELLGVAGTDPAIAAVASKMLLYQKPGFLNGVGGAMNYLGYTWDRGMFEQDRGQYDRSEEVLFACGGAALFRRSAFLDAGDFDERFFMYHEDVDLCWRLWLLGHRVVTAPQARIYHRFSASTRDNRGMDWRELIGERNNIRSLIKNYELPNLRRALRDLAELPQLPERKAAQQDNLRWNKRHLLSTLWHRFRIQWRRKRSDDQLRHLIDPRPQVPIRIDDFQTIERAREKEEEDPERG